MSIPLPTLVGRNVQRLRTAVGATQQQLADAAAQLGLPWPADRVSQAERGRWAPGLTQLVVLAAALDRLPGRTSPVTLADLVAVPVGEGSVLVELSEAVTVPAEDLAMLLRGEPSGPRIPQRAPAKHVPVRGRRAGYAAVDRRVAAELGVTADEMLAASRHTWGRSLSEERAARIAANTAERGEPLGQTAKAIITALLRDELKTTIEIDAAGRGRSVVQCGVRTGGLQAD